MKMLDNTKRFFSVLLMAVAIGVMQIASPTVTEAATTEQVFEQTKDGTQELFIVNRISGEVIVFGEMTHYNYQEKALMCQNLLKAEKNAHIVIVDRNQKRAVIYTTDDNFSMEAEDSIKWILNGIKFNKKNVKIDRFEDGNYDNLQVQFI